MTQISRKYDFLPGTKIYSNQIDDEFNQLVTESNSQDTRLTSVETDKHTHTNKTVLDKLTQTGAEASFDLSNFATKGEASNVTAHKSTHATGGSDALTPGDIGAQPALGYTPVNKAGDTITGGLIIDNGLTVSNGNDLYLKAASGTDSGDIVFTDSAGVEIGRFYKGTTNMNVRFGATDTVKDLWHTGLLRWNNGKLEYNDGGIWKEVGGGVKSIQRGVAAAGTVDVTISPVDTSKASVNLLTTVASEWVGSISIQLLNSTTLRITSDIGRSVSWEVIEYA